MGLLEVLLPVVEKVAENLAGSSLADDAVKDVENVKAIASRHASALEAELAQWLAARLHPQLPQAAPSQ